MNYIDKLNNIISLLINPNKKFGITNTAKYWKIDTSIFNTFDRLYENIKDKDISYKIKSLQDNSHLTTQGANVTYYLSLNNENITPAKDKKYVSMAAIHQYASMIFSFGLGNIDWTKFKNKKSFVLEGEIELNAQIKVLIRKENRINLIKDVICKSLFSNTADMRNIAYSIIIELLFAYHFDMKLLKDKNKIFYWSTSRGQAKGGNFKHANLINDYVMIKKDIEDGGTISTYKQIVSCVLEHYHDLEYFINDIYSQYEILLNEKEVDHLVVEQVLALKIIDELKLARSRFKDNIFNDRKDKHLIEYKTDLYTDIINLNTNSIDGLVSKFNEAEAAHIFAFHQIQHEIISNLSNDVNIKNNIQYVSNPSNGLIMKHEYHKSYDRGQWYFNSNGEMVVPVENQNYLFNILKLQKIKIRPEIFNEKLKKFLVMKL